MELRPYQRAAIDGLIRNQQMLDQGMPDVVVAFPGGTDTADMKRRALLGDVPVWEPAA